MKRLPCKEFDPLSLIEYFIQQVHCGVRFLVLFIQVVDRPLSFAIEKMVAVPNLDFLGENWGTAGVDLLENRFFSKRHQR